MTFPDGTGDPVDKTVILCRTEPGVFTGDHSSVIQFQILQTVFTFTDTPPIRNGEIHTADFFLPVKIRTEIFDIFRDHALAGETELTVRRAFPFDQRKKFRIRGKIFFRRHIQLQTVSASAQRIGIVQNFP